MSNHSKLIATEDKSKIKTWQLTAKELSVDAAAAVFYQKLGGIFTFKKKRAKSGAEVFSWLVSG